MSTRTLRSEVVSAFARLTATLPSVDGFTWALDERSSVYGPYRYRIVLREDSTGGEYTSPLGESYMSASGLVDAVRLVLRVTNLSASLARL